MKLQLLLFFGVRAVTLALIVGAAFVLDKLFGFPILRFPLQQFVGIPLILVTKAFDYESINAFRRAGGTFFYTHPPEKVVDTGPYGHVRNPLYLTLFTDAFGFFLIYGSTAYLIVLILLIVGIDRVVITKEEPQMESRFGDAYLDYKRRVPRWIPRVPRS